MRGQTCSHAQVSSVQQKYDVECSKTCDKCSARAGDPPTADELCTSQEAKGDSADLVAHYLFYRSSRFYASSDDRKEACDSVWAEAEVQ